MTYVCPAWELTADSYLSKLTMLYAPLEIFQDAHRSTICTRLSNFRMYTIYNKLRRQQAEVIQNRVNEHVRSIGEARHRKYKRLKLGGGQAYDPSSDKDPL
jgi:hypothetical protein